eukprot:1140517-Pelagomonas_calceolata.AAC.1
MGHIGSKSRESPSTEGKREASVGLVTRLWWVFESMRPQGTRVMLSVFDCNGTPGRGKLLRMLHRVGMEVSCKLSRPLRVNPIHCVVAVRLLAGHQASCQAGVVLLLTSLRLILRSPRCEGGVGGLFRLAEQGVTKIASGRLE